MRRTRSLATIVTMAAVLAVALPSKAGSPEPGAKSRRCPRFGAAHVVGSLGGLSGIREISGVVAAHRHRHTLWVEQDSADPSRRIIHAITPTGRGKASITVNRAANIDWEDIAYWDGRLWIGDIGDNGTRRPNVQVYWFREPRLRNHSLNARMATLRYPGGRSHNAEAMIVTGGNLFIVSKESGGSGTVYRADVTPLRNGAHRQMRQIGTIPLGTVSAADVGPRGILVKNYTRGLLYRWSADHSVAATIRRNPCDVPVGPGEAIAFTTWNRSYYSIPEGENPKVYVNRPR